MSLKKKLLLVAITLCLVLVGTEINSLFINGLHEIEELLLSLLLITFLIILVMYLFNNIFLNAYLKRNRLEENKKLTNF